ncbi:unnamed protein product [Paramecium pentaurelia]|uniref:AIG1-type G domain-containing protein n=1 Tax=Paramecium pentaurelia TaxID=43138 RepID=A0A8S1TK39_9CILI|nr:unnamed protein product [Paramecium pentaurelia]
MNEMIANETLLKLIDELHVEDIESFLKSDQQITQKYQLVKDQNVYGLISVLENELGVDKTQILNVAWKFKKNLILTRYNLTFITKEQALDYHISYQKFLEWKTKPENQSYQPFFKIKIEFTKPQIVFNQDKAYQFYQQNTSQSTTIQNNKFITFQQSQSNTQYQKEVNQIKFASPYNPIQNQQQIPLKQQSINQHSMFQSPQFSNLYFNPKAISNNHSQSIPCLKNQQDQSFLINKLKIQQFNVQPNNFRFNTFYNLKTQNEIKKQSFPQNYLIEKKSELELSKELPGQNNSKELEKSYRKTNLEQLAQNCILLKEIKGKKVTLQIRKYPQYTQNELQDINLMKTIMIIGETGVGKSTLINFFCNFYIGVEFEFPFRFYLVDETNETVFKQSQAVSKTSEVISYYLKGSNGKPPLRIIDTPGFGDTRGQNFDKIISERISDQLKELEQLSLICFVIKSSQNRLTLDQIYIMNSLLQLFGKDAVEHFMFLFTFSDFEEPSALQALLFEGNSVYQGSPFANIVPKIEAPFWLQFNNQAFISLERKEFIKNSWNDTFQQFQILYLNKICKSKFLNLTLTKQVIEQRKQIMDIIEKLKKQIQQSMNLINEINTASNINEILKSEQLQSKTFCGSLIKELLLTINKFNQIALQPFTKDFQKECLDILIKEEDEQKNDGYQMRVLGLQDIKELWNSYLIQ